MSRHWQASPSPVSRLGRLIPGADRTTHALALSLAWLLGCLNGSPPPEGVGAALAGDPSEDNCGFDVVAATPLDPCEDGILVVPRRRIQRERGAPRPVQLPFDVMEVGTLCLLVNNSAVSSASVMLDREIIVRPSDLNPHVTVLARLARIAEGEHALTTQVRGRPGSSLTLEARFVPATSIPPEVPGDHGIIGVAIRPATPDVFSPGASEGVLDDTELSANVSIAEAAISTPHHQLRYQFEVAGGRSCGFVRAIVGVAELPRVSTLTSQIIAARWDGRDASGDIVPDGAYYFRAVVELVRDHPRDPRALDRVVSEIGRVVVDNSPPDVAILTPSEGALVGTRSFQVGASDPSGVRHVEFGVDGTSILVRSLLPYAIELDSGTLANGAHVLETTALDAAGNSAAASIDVVVDNPPTFAVSRFTPEAASPGTYLAIDGAGFDPSDPARNEVTVGGATAYVVGASTTTLLVIVPEGATDGPVSVRSGGGSATSPAAFELLAPRFTFPRDVVIEIPPGHMPSWVEFKAQEGTQYRVREGQLVSLGVDPLDPIYEVLVRHGVELGERPFDETSLDALEEQGELRTGIDIPNPNLLFRIDIEPATDAAALVADLRAIPEIEVAAAAPLVEDLGDIAPPTCDLRGAQNYRHPSNYRPLLDEADRTALGGVNGEMALAIAGGDGSGIRVTSVETWWAIDPDTGLWRHEDLSLQAPPVLLGHAARAVIRTGLDAHDPTGFHGLATTGIIVADPDDVGMTGLAPGVGFQLSTTVGRFNTVGTPIGGDFDIALGSAVGASRPGDIIFTTAGNFNPRFGSVPVSDDPAGRIWMEVGTGMGIVMIESAGNDDLDLDTVPGFRPSDPRAGSIIVTGGHPLTHDRVIDPSTGSPVFSIGSHVRLQGWGTQVATLGGCQLFHALPGEPPPFCGSPAPCPAFDSVQGYTPSFSGTSAAAPMVAGAAASLQGIRLAHGLPLLDGPQMERVLRETGTPGVGDLSDMPLPDLHRAASRILSAATRVIARGNLVFILHQSRPVASPGASGVHVVDVSSPSSPAIVATVPSFFGPGVPIEDIAVSSDGRTLIQAVGFGVLVYDLSDLGDPRLVRGMSLVGRPLALDRDDRPPGGPITLAAGSESAATGAGFLESMTDSASLDAIEIPETRSETALEFARLGFFPTPTFRAFLGGQNTAGAGFLTLASVRDPTNLTIRSTIQVTDPAARDGTVTGFTLLPITPEFVPLSGVAVGWNRDDTPGRGLRSHAWIVSYNADILELTGTALLFPSSLGLDGQANGVATAADALDNIVFVTAAGIDEELRDPGTGLGWLTALDFASSTSFRRLPSTRLPSNALDIDVTRDAAGRAIAYIATELVGLLIVDVGDPANPVILGRLSLPISGAP